VKKPLLSDEDCRLIDIAIAGAPPLTTEQISEIRQILRPWEWQPLPPRAEGVMAA
jgi:hypothetical protein